MAMGMAPGADAIFEQFFQVADVDRDGRISGAEAVNFFKGSGLPQPTLALVWQFSDVRQAGFLTRPEFFNAMRLVTVAQSGRPLNAEVARAALSGPAAAQIPPPRMALPQGAPAPYGAGPRPQGPGMPGPGQMQMGGAMQRPPGMPAAPPQQYAAPWAAQPRGPGGFPGQPGAVPGMPGQAPPGAYGMPQPQRGPAFPPGQAPGMGMSVGAAGSSPAKGGTAMRPSAAGPNPDKFAEFGDLAFGRSGSSSAKSSAPSTSSSPAKPQQPPAPAPAPAPAPTGPVVSPTRPSPAAPLPEDMFGASAAFTATPAPQPQPQQIPQHMARQIPQQVPQQLQAQQQMQAQQQIPQQAARVSPQPGAPQAAPLGQPAPAAGPPQGLVPSTEKTGAGDAGSKPKTADSAAAAALDAFLKTDSKGPGTTSGMNGSAGPSPPPPGAEAQAGVVYIMVPGDPKPWPRMALQEAQQYTQIFASVDKDRDGKISGEEARKTLLSFQVPIDVLKQVWDLADEDDDGMLSLREFATACYLIQRAREGRRMPAVLPQGYHFDQPMPDQRAAIAAARIAEAQAALAQNSAGVNVPAWRFDPAVLKPRADAKSDPQQQQQSRVVNTAVGLMPVAAKADDIASGPPVYRSRAPEMEMGKVRQLDKEEQEVMLKKHADAEAASKKVWETEAEIMDAKKKIDFYRTKMQEIIMFKSRCDNKLADITEQAAAEKREVEQLSKRYDEKYKATHEQVSRLAFEEKALQDLQAKKNVLQNAVMRLEHGGDPNELLQERADKLAADLEELRRTVNRRAKQLGLVARPLLGSETPFGWQAGMQEGAVDWDEDWDEFIDDGFVVVRDLTGGAPLGEDEEAFPIVPLKPLQQTPAAPESAAEPAADMLQFGRDEEDIGPAQESKGLDKEGEAGEVVDAPGGDGAGAQAPAEEGEEAEEGMREEDEGLGPEEEAHEGHVEEEGEVEVEEEEEEQNGSFWPPPSLQKKAAVPTLVPKAAADGEVEEGGSFWPPPSLKRDAEPEERLEGRDSGEASEGESFWPPPALKKSKEPSPTNGWPQPAADEEPLPAYTFTGAQSGLAASASFGGPEEESAGGAPERTREEEEEVSSSAAATPMASDAAPTEFSHSEAYRFNESWDTFSPSAATAQTQQSQGFHAADFMGVSFAAGFDDHFDRANPEDDDRSTPDLRGRAPSEDPSPVPSPAVKPEDGAAAGPADPFAEFGLGTFRATKA